MKNNKFLKNAAGVTLGIIAAIILYMSFPNVTSDNKEVTVADDYYVAINKNILDDKELETDETYWSVFTTQTQEKVDDNVSTIIDEIIENNSNSKITTLYDSIINQENDLSAIDYYIEKIDSSQTIDELMDNVAIVNNDLSMGLFINPTIENDYIDNDYNIINIYPFVFDYNNMYSDYYTNPLYYSYVATYIEYDRQILELYGYTEDEAKESVKLVSKFYAQIADSSKSMEELTNYASLYNVVSNEELNEIYSNIDISKFISSLGNNMSISIVDIEQAKALNQYFVEENLQTLKEYCKLLILQTYAQYGSSDYYNLMFELQAELTGTENTSDTIEDYATDIIASYFDADISQIYVEKYASEASINDFETIVNNIIDQYKVKIANNTWLSEATKEKALIKLESMTANIGYPENWLDYSENYNLGDSLLENVINMNKAMVDCVIEAEQNKTEYWQISPLTVNAYYNPQDNSINFPIALLEYDLYNEDSSYYQELGSLGFVIAHEITHAFDNNGALFDEKGNLSNWWTEEDYKNFENYQEQVIAYYNTYKVNGKSINGSKTVGENIADLGAMSCIIEIAEKNNATTEEYQELFEAYANLWASKATEEYMELLLIMDTHSPDSVRVNAVLSSTQKFYEVYNITESDAMFVSEENRVAVW